MATTTVTNNIGLDAFKDSNGHVNWDSVWNDLKGRVNSLGFKSTYGDKGCNSYSFYEKCLRKSPDYYNYGQMIGCCAKIIDNYGNPATFAIICTGEKTRQAAFVSAIARSKQLKVEEHYFIVEQRTDGTKEDTTSAYVEMIRVADMTMDSINNAYNDFYNSASSDLAKAPSRNLTLDDIFTYYPARGEYIVSSANTMKSYYDYISSNYNRIYSEKAQMKFDSPITLSDKREPLFWYLSDIPIIDNSKNSNKNKNLMDEIISGNWNVEPLERPIDTKTNWKVYIDGTKLPNYKIIWHNEEIESSKSTDNARIQIQYAEVDAEYPVELRVNELIHETNYAEYNDGNYKTNFKTIYEGAWGEVYNEGIMSTLPKQSVWLLLQLDFYGNGITTVLPTQTSTKMAVLLNPSGSKLYSYADMWNTDGESDGSIIEVVTDEGSGEGDDGYEDDTDKGEEDITDGASNSVGVLTTTYAMTIERLNQLGGFLWGANIFDEFSLVNSNPIENIISCKNIPISLSGTDEIIHLGNVDTGTNGAKVASNFSTLNVGQIALPTKYNSFLDFAPYTKITIYLPYIGFKEIDATIAIGKTLKVAYVADVITGGCIAQIFINGVRFYEFSGEMGIDIPITASNRAQVEASYISNAVGMGASLASGNITGAVDSVLASATAKYNYSSTDTPNANCVASVNRTCYVIIERPTYQELSQFNHTKGKMCNLSKTIGSLKGFTICDANIDLKGITATEQEKQEISSILSSGFFA